MLNFNKKILPSLGGLQICNFCLLVDHHRNACFSEVINYLSRSNSQAHAAV